MLTRYEILGFADPISSWTHLFAAIVFLGLSFSLLRARSYTSEQQISLGVFAFACFLLLAMSGLYHSMPRDGLPRLVLQRIDHAAIFILIAGTFTPIHIFLFRGFARWGMLLFIWTTAIVALTLKTVYFNDIPSGVGATMYLLLGWVGAFSGYAIWRRHGFTLIRPMLDGAIAYTTGAIIDLFDSVWFLTGIFGAHELFHLFVIIGISYHWKFVKSFATNPSLHPDLE